MSVARLLACSMVLGLSAVSCGSDDGTEPESSTEDVKETYDVGRTQRAACAFRAGDRTEKTIGPNVPRGASLPFEHIVVLMMENRSFDSYFSNLPAHGVNVKVAPPDASNPDPSTGKPVKRFHETRYCIQDTNHHWGPVHQQLGGGRMDGFVATSNPGGARAMGYYDQRDIPYFYWLAKTFGTSDAYFSPLPGPTWPNRFYFWGATSWGRTETPDKPPIGKTKIVDQLESVGRTWKIYRDGLASFGIVFGPKYAGSKMEQFDEDVAQNKLPNLALIDPDFMGDGQNDDHPPANIQKGQAFVKRVVDRLMSNPTVWRKTVLFITYDEHGGIYDHVPPPPACVPDGDKPAQYAFDRYGVRVPLLIVSPFNKPGHVSHVIADHTSITRFIQNRFGLPAMTARDANAWPLLDFFDFEKKPFLVPPKGAPDATPSKAGLDWCANNKPGTGMPGTVVGDPKVYTDEAGSCASPAFDGNDTASSALYLGEMGDCDSPKSVTGSSANARDIDYFFFQGRDKLCRTDTHAKISRPELRLCAFALCPKGSTTVSSCAKGKQETSETGLVGCCSDAAGEVQLDHNCKSGITGTNDDAQVYLRVDRPSGSNSCIDYKIDYNF